MPASILSCFSRLVLWRAAQISWRGARCARGARRAARARAARPGAPRYRRGRGLQRAGFPRPRRSRRGSSPGGAAARPHVDALRDLAGLLVARGLGELRAGVGERAQPVPADHDVARPQRNAVQRTAQRGGRRLELLREDDFLLALERAGAADLLEVRLERRRSRTTSASTVMPPPSQAFPGRSASIGVWLLSFTGVPRARRGMPVAALLARGRAGEEAGAIYRTPACGAARDTRRRTGRASPTLISPSAASQ